MDTLFVLQAGALALLALGSGLVLHLISQADVGAERPARPASQSAAPEPETLRRAA
jgi:hypothetical protein